MYVYISDSPCPITGPV